MQTLNLTLPDSLGEFVRQQTAESGFADENAYIQQLIQAELKERILETVESDLVEGLESGETEPVSQKFWDDLQDRVQERLAKKQQG